MVETLVYDDTLIDDLSARLKALPRGHIVALSGAPASGKSTLAEHLAERLGPNAALLAMDGYHFDNDHLARIGLSHRKGAPETFDVAGFSATLAEIRAGRATPLPAFDRTLDAVVPNAAQFEPHTHSLTLVEGNYLLLDEAPWSALAAFWDLTLFLDVPLDVLEARHTARWAAHGRDPIEAAHWIETNDMPNARRVAENSRTADIHITLP